MENQEARRPDHRSAHHRSRGRFLGTVFVILGIFWLLKETGWAHSLPGWDTFHHSFSNFLNVFQFNAWHVTWPIILLLVGFVLLAGRRLIGGILIVFAVIFFLPHFLIIPGILAIFFLPVLLIVLGIIVIRHLL